MFTDKREKKGLYNNFIVNFMFYRKVFSSHFTNIRDNLLQIIHRLIQNDYFILLGRITHVLRNLRLRFTWSFIHTEFKRFIKWQTNLLGDFIKSFPNASPVFIRKKAPKMQRHLRNNMDGRHSDLPLLFYWLFVIIQITSDDLNAQG